MHLLVKQCVMAAIFLLTTTIGFTTQANLYEGNMCDLHTGVKGICKNVLKCNWLMQNIQDRSMNLSDIRRCSFSARFSDIICCGDRQFSANHEEPPRPCQEEFYLDFNCSSTSHTQNINNKNYGMKIREACTKYSAVSTPFSPPLGVIRGTTTRLTEFPHVAALGYPTPRTNEYDFDCGASLIAEQWTITAAHCVKERRKPVIIRFGQIYLFSESREGGDRPILRIVRQAYSIVTKKNDIALIEFKGAITFTRYVRPACIRTDIEDLHESVDLRIAGWGSIEPERTNRSEVLQKATVYTVPLGKCSEQLKTINLANLPSLNGVSQSQMCATNKIEGSDACQGDSGGPIFQYSEATGVSVIVGIVSFGISCGTEVPGVYTRIASYTEWIESIVWP